MTVLAGLGPERVSESAVAEMLVRHINWHHWQTADSGRNGQFLMPIAFLPRSTRCGFSCHLALVVSPRAQPNQPPAVEFDAVRPTLECPSTDIR